MIIDQLEAKLQQEVDKYNELETKKNEIVVTQQQTLGRAQVYQEQLQELKLKESSQNQKAEVIEGTATEVPSKDDSDKVS